MTETITGILSDIGLALDVIGVLIVAIGALLALGHAMIDRSKPFKKRYPVLREEMGRAILLGLEMLIAGDIIRTVVVDPTLMNVAVLGLIVVVRTFLSMTLQLEIEGRLPWQRSAPDGAPPIH